jgi:hypothetical protein
VTELPDVNELKLLEARRDAAAESLPLAIKAWLGTLDRIRVRIASGALTKTERKLSLATIAVIEEELDRAWRSFRTRDSGQPATYQIRSREAEDAREHILDQLVRLRVALTANVSVRPSR